MPKMTFLNHDGSEKTVDAQSGATIMETARLHFIKGIDAECGGACACATCHVYVQEQWIERVGRPSEMEEDMLDFASNVLKNSRLSCQIKMTDELDGLIVKIPEKQF
ncbi:MAG: 2Fe-2S iron-sulfur cluster binding domain-containing protein [Hyphomicrobiaceae bacterium]|nr:2Fe-2S iron-sulfur cluster binding domain-containing protein [Hyphomicrobiaceae bacterium]